VIHSFPQCRTLSLGPQPESFSKEPALIQREKVLCNAKAHTSGSRAGTNAERLFAAAVKLERHKETLMHAQRRIRRLMGIALLAATTSFARQVKIDYDRITDFSKYKTYDWEKVHTQNAVWVDRIKAAVNSALAAKGWMQAESAGDVSITVPRAVALVVIDVDGY
jgi:hypothetical protein